MPRLALDGMLVEIEATAVVVGERAGIPVCGSGEKRWRDRNTMSAATHAHVEFNARAEMESPLQFQLRITASAELADALRTDPSYAAHAALRDVLRKHDATLKCQFDAFADYVSEAEKLGTENYPLYRWTRETIDNPQKKAKYLQSFTVYVNGDEVYGRQIADAMEAELLKLVGEDGIERVARFDTNPANNPQPPVR